MLSSAEAVNSFSPMCSVFVFIGIDFINAFYSLLILHLHFASLRFMLLIFRCNRDIVTAGGQLWWASVYSDNLPLHCSVCYRQQLNWSEWSSSSRTLWRSYKTSSWLMFLECRSDFPTSKSAVARFALHSFFVVCFACGAGAPLFPLVHSLPHLFPFLLFPFFHWLYLFSSFVHPFPFYQNSPTPFPGRRSCAFLQCFDTVGWVIWPVKTRPHMTYNVLVGG